VVPFPQRFAAAARAGFTAVEFLFPYDHAAKEVAAWLEENRLENVLFNLPPGDWGAGERGIAAIPGREEEFSASVARALEYADALDTPRLHAMAGLLPAGADRDRHREVYIQNLRHAAKALAEAHTIREAVGAPNLKVQMDFYHVQIVEGDIAMTFRKYFPHVGHIQIASVPERNEPDDGEVNYRYLFRVIDELGYDGWVGCEYRPRAGTEPGLGWLKTLV
jgi:2-dehydrotetronate isomerase